MFYDDFVAALGNDRLVKKDEPIWPLLAQFTAAVAIEGSTCKLFPPAYLLPLRTIQF